MGARTTLLITKGNYFSFFNDGDTAEVEFEIPKVQSCSWVAVTSEVISSEIPYPRGILLGWIPCGESVIILLDGAFRFRGCPYWEQ